jgi:hypothetical protein
VRESCSFRAIHSHFGTRYSDYGLYRAIGAVWFLYLAGYNMSIGVWVGPAQERPAVVEEVVW